MFVCMQEHSMSMLWEWSGDETYMYDKFGLVRAALGIVLAESDLTLRLKCLYYKKSHCLDNAISVNISSPTVVNPRHMYEGYGSCYVCARYHQARCYIPPHFHVENQVPLGFLHVAVSTYVLCGCFLTSSR